jgi:hypothetical protein
VWAAPTFHKLTMKVALQRSVSDGKLHQPHENMEKTGFVTKSAFSPKKPLAAPERFP